MITIPRSAGQFRVTSKEDFSIRAKHLAWLLGIPLQQAQSLLAQGYGFSDYHALQQDLTRAKQDPSSHPCGPFDDEVNAAFFRLPGQAVDPRASAISGVERDNRLLRLIGQHFKFSNQPMPLRCFDAREMGLFARPSQHRTSFRRVKGKYDVLDDKSFAPKEHELEDYAFVGSSAAGHEAIFEFTALGRAVMDALDHLETIFSGRREIEPPDFEEKLDRLAKQHPNNPWVFATYVISLSEPYWQDGWANGGVDHDCANDHESGFKRSAPVYAASLLPKAKKAVSLFEGILRSAGKPLAPESLATFHTEYGTDSDHYPLVLYWGAKVALNAGDVPLATKWFNKCVRLKTRNAYSAKQYLAVLHLNAGKGPVGKLLSAQDEHPWAELSRMAEQIRLGDRNNAVRHLFKGLISSPHLIRALDPSFRDNDRIHVMTNIDTLQIVQEWLHFTEPFWKQHPDAWAWLRILVKDPAIRKAYKDYHRANEETFGSAFKEHAVVQRFRQKAIKAEGQLKQALDHAAALSTANPL